jgi:hypothetical protein
MNRGYLNCKAVLVGVSIMFLSGATFTYSQEAVDEAKLQMYYGLGSGHMKIAALNDRVKELGLPEFTQKPFMFEIGTHFLVQQLVLDGAVGGIVWKSVSNNDNNASLAGGYTHMSLGVNFILPGEAWELYPYFTLGVGVYRYALTQTHTFDETSTSVIGQRTAAYWMPTFITGTGGALYYTAYNASKTRAFTLGVRGGVMMDPTRQTNWFKNGEKYRNGPAPLFAGPYIQFVVASGHYFK